MRALGSHQCGLGSIPARRHMWVEFVVGFRPCSEGFSPVFLLPAKTNISNFNSILIEDLHEKQLELMWLRL